MSHLSRRHVLRGAGVALTLPFLESLAPRPARGQAPPPRRRFVAFYFPLGVVTPGFWTPAQTGTGGAWSLSPLLAPLAPVKSRVTVLGRVDQTVYPNGIEPSNGPLTGSYLTAVKCMSASSNGQAIGRAGISIDQRIAQLPTMAAPLPSLQLGLATHQSFCDGTPCSLSRSISWQDETTPLFKLINPQDVFNKIVASPATPSQLTARAKARKSVLDFVLGGAQSVQGQLGKTDRARFDQFLTSVRDLEQRVTMLAPPPLSCPNVSRPTLAADVDMVPADYNRDDHANVMLDLVTMALTCDATRVVSFMLDDARADLVYDFLNLRTFTATGSTETTTPLHETPLGGANSPWPDDGWATIVFWYVSKLARLCQALANVPDDGGVSLLDNSVVWFGSGMVREWDWRNLPVLYVGGGGGLLKVDQYVPFPSTQSLSNLYLTFLRNVFGSGAAVPETSFGDSTGTVPSILV
jgi:hypothetical protein